MNIVPSVSRRTGYPYLRKLNIARVLYRSLKVNEESSMLRVKIFIVGDHVEHSCRWLLETFPRLSWLSPFSIMINRGAEEQRLLTLMLEKGAIRKLGSFRYLKRKPTPSLLNSANGVTKCTDWLYGKNSVEQNWKWSLILMHEESTTRNLESKRWPMIVPTQTLLSPANGVTTVYRWP